jgi:hypothetical protein
MHQQVRIRLELCIKGVQAFIPVVLFFSAKGQ